MINLLIDNADNIRKNSASDSKNEVKSYISDVANDS